MFSTTPMFSPPIVALPYITALALLPTPYCTSNPQLELEEEKRIAAEMALNRLRRKAAERRRRASLSRSNSPMGGDGGGRIGGGGSPRLPGSPGSPDNGAGDTGGSGGGTGEGSPPRGRRPSLMQVID